MGHRMIFASVESKYASIKYFVLCYTLSNCTVTLDFSRNFVSLSHLSFHFFNDMAEKESAIRGLIRYCSDLFRRLSHSSAGIALIGVGASGGAALACYAIKFAVDQWPLWHVWLRSFIRTFFPLWAKQICDRVSYRHLFTISCMIYWRFYSNMECSYISHIYKDDKYGVVINYAVLNAIGLFEVIWTFAYDLMQKAMAVSLCILIPACIRLQWRGYGGHRARA